MRGGGRYGVNQIAIVILSKGIPTPSAIEFYKSLKRDKYDIFIMVDDKVTLPISNEITYLQVDDTDCRDKGWVNANFVIPKTPSAWDKALYYFSNIVTYPYTWFIEEDVFIPTLSTILNIDNKYQVSDLLSSGHNINRNGQLD